MTGWAFAALMIANICLAFGPWLVRLADVGPVAVGFWRLALAAPLLLLLTRAAGQPMPRGRVRLWVILFLAGLFFAADLACWHAGILHTRLANAALFGTSSGLMFPLYGFIIARRLPDRYQSAALLLAGVGATLLLARSYELSSRYLLGDLLCLGAGLFYTAYLIAIERARGHLAALPTIAFASLFGAAPMLVCAIAFGERIIPDVWWPLLVLAISSQVVGQGLMVFAIGYLSPLVVGLTFLLQPLVAAAIGWLAYAEALNVADMIGAVAIGIALVLVRRPTPARSPLPQN
ncbi:MAG TPA: DMT family transporter [Sphingomonadaceae bacterium]|nr:DMT family transporter [Sphingomonadaceae bacterium]